MGTGNVVQPPNSIADQIYLSLKQRILANEIQPNQRLMQQDVANDYNASRTPVREAFRLLEQDNLVERIPQGGVRVVELDIDAIREIFAVRAELEAYAIKLACKNISDEDLYNLHNIARQAREIMQSPFSMRDKYFKLLQLNSIFHDTIYTATGSRYLLSFLSGLREMVLCLRAISLRDHESWPQVWDEHFELLACLERRDKKQAAALIRAHIASSIPYTASHVPHHEGNHD